MTKLAVLLVLSCAGSVLAQGKVDAGDALASDGRAVACTDGFFFTWPPAAITEHQRDRRGVAVVTLGWVVSETSFVVPLPQDRRLVASRAGTQAPRKAMTEAKTGLNLSLPLQQGRAILSEAGVGDRCVVKARAQSLSSPLKTAHFDATVGWRFEVLSAAGSVLFAF